MSRTGTGAIIALNAIGKQDQILYNLDNYNTCDSPFYSDHKRISHYTKFYKSYVRNGPSGSLTWPFTGSGDKVGFIIDPRISGDLLTNVFLKIDLPAITTSTWTDKIGRAIIQSVEFRVDNIIVEKLTDMDLIFKDEIFTTEHDNTVRNYCQNGRLYTNSLTEEDYLNNPPVLSISPDHNRSALKLYINLGFCFGRTHSYKPEAFPLAAIGKQNVYIDIQFRPKSWFTGTDDLVYTDKVTLVTEQITLTDQERIFLRHKPFSIKYKTVEKRQSVQPDKDADTFSQTGIASGSVDQLTTKLNNTRPVSLIGWFFQNRRFLNIESGDSINTSNLYLNRYNFGSHENFSNINPLVDGYIEPYYGFNEDNFPLCAQIELLSDKTDLKLLYTGSDAKTIPSTSVFFRDILSQSKGLYRPVKNIFTYSFEESPLSPTENGSAKDSISNYKLFNVLINNDEVLSNVYDINIYNVCYTTLNFEGGELVKKI